MTPQLAGATAAALLTLVVATLVLRRRVVVITVEGLSMVPTLRPGDRVLVRRVAAQQVRLGDVVVMREQPPGRSGDHAGRAAARWVVKRVAALPGDPEPAFLPAWARGDGTVADGTLVLLGDNPSVSRDSRHVGGVPVERLLGVAVRLLGGGALPPPPAARRER